jgi:hypothetical protein
MFGFLFRSTVIIGTIYISSPVLLQASHPLTSASFAALSEAGFSSARMAQTIDPTSPAALGAQFCASNGESCMATARTIASDVAASVLGGGVSRDSGRPRETLSLGALMEAAAEPPRRPGGRSESLLKSR